MVNPYLRINRSLAQMSTKAPLVGVGLTKDFLQGLSPTSTGIYHHIHYPAEGVEIAHIKVHVVGEVVHCRTVKCHHCS